MDEIDVVLVSDDESLSDLSTDSSEAKPPAKRPKLDHQQQPEEEEEAAAEEKEEAKEEEKEEEQQQKALEALRRQLLQQLQELGGDTAEEEVEQEVEVDVPVDFFGNTGRNLKWQRASTDPVQKKAYLDRLDRHPTKVRILAAEKKDWIVPFFDKVTPLYKYWSNPVKVAQREALEEKFGPLIKGYLVHHTILRVTFLREAHYQFISTRIRRAGVRRATPPQIRYYAYSKVHSKLCQVHPYQAYRISVHLRRPKPRTSYIKHESRFVEQDSPVRSQYLCAAPDNENPLPVLHKSRLKKLRALSIWNNNPHLTFHVLTNETENVVFAYEAAYSKTPWIKQNSSRVPTPTPETPYNLWRFVDPADTEV
jgi:hypothetical protein